VFELQLQVESNFKLKFVTCKADIKEFLNPVNVFDTVKVVSCHTIFLINQEQLKINYQLLEDNLI